MCCQYKHNHTKLNEFSHYHSSMIVLAVNTSVYQVKDMAVDDHGNIYYMTSLSSATYGDQILMYVERTQEVHWIFNIHMGSSYDYRESDDNDMDSVTDKGSVNGLVLNNQGSLLIIEDDQANVNHVDEHATFRIREIGIVCPGGYHWEFFDDGPACTQCNIGYWAPEDNNLHNCTSCPVGTYSQTEESNTEDNCLPCPEGFYCPTVSASVPCPEGTFNENTNSIDQSDCQLCNPGYFCPQGSAIEIICPASFYAQNPGSTVCTPCPPGRVSNAGAIAEIECVNPGPNFAMGYLCLGVVAGTIGMYISHGRFHRVAFLRKYRAFNLLYFEARNVEAKLFQRMILHAVNEERDQYFLSISRVIKVSVWLFFTTLGIILVVVGAYIMILSKVLFHSLLVWKGVNMPELGFQDKIDEMSRAFERLPGLGPFLSLLMYPFEQFIIFIGSFTIDLGSVEVTCMGAQAPMELLINCFVLGFIVSPSHCSYSLCSLEILG